MRPFPCCQLTDRALEANACMLAVAVLSHGVAAQFTGPTIEAMVAISERSPPSLSTAEREFLRQAIATADMAEIAISRQAGAPEAA